MARSRSSARWIAALWLVAFALPALGEMSNDFSFYPDEAQSCLEDASDNASCDGDDVRQLNTCLCSNGGDFITNTAKCLGEKNSKSINTVYSIMADACDTSNTTISLTSKEFQDAASGTSTTTTGTSEPTTTDEADAAATSDRSEVHPLTTKGLIGVAVGAAIVGAGIVAGVGWLLFRRFKKRTEEASPMLQQNSNGSNSSQPATATGDPAPGYTAFSESKSPAMTESTHPSAPPYQFQDGPSELQGQTIAFEMEGDTSYRPAAEMPGCAPMQQEMPGSAPGHRG